MIVKKQEWAILKKMERDFIIISGAQGYGKSFWAKLFTRLVARLLVYDFKLSFPNVLFQKLTPEIFDNILQNHGNFRIGSGYFDDIDILSNLSYAAGNNTLVLEECGTIFRRGQSMQAWGKRMVFAGREQRANLILVAQRAASIPIDIRSQANRIVSFMQHEQEDIRALITKIGSSYRWKLPALPQFQCIDWNDGHVSEYSILNDVKTYFPQRGNNDESNRMSDMQEMA